MTIVDETDDSKTPLQATQGAAQAGVVDPFDFSQDVTIQEDKIAFADSVFRQAQGNVLGSLMFDCDVTYSSRADAVLSTDTFSALLKQKMHVKLTQDGTDIYYPNALLKSYRYKLGGNAVKHSFAFTCDAQTTTPQ